jgi:AraC-like DNA-binding protein
MENIDYNVNIVPVEWRDFDSRMLATGEMPVRTTTEFEIEYFYDCPSDGCGGIELCGKFVPFKSGTANFRVPGQTVRGIPPYKCICLAFSTDDRYLCQFLMGLPFVLSDDQCWGIHDLLSQIYRKLMLNNLTSYLSAKGNIFELIALLIKSTDTSGTQRINTYIYNALNFIHMNFKYDIKISDIAKAVSIEEHYFHNLFKKQMGISPWKYIVDLRISEAKKLLRNSLLPIGKVAELSGFYDSVYFSYKFKAITNLTPGDWRKGI